MTGDICTEYGTLICGLSAGRGGGRGQGGGGRTSSMPNEARISMSLRKRPCRNRYPDRPGARSPSTTDPVPILGDLMEAISLTIAFCSVSEDAASRQDISLLETHQPHHPPPL